MKALFFLNSFAGGGAERVCLNLAKQLYQLKIESDFIIIYNKKPDYDIPDYIHIFSLEIEDRRGECLEIVMKSPKVNAFIADKEYVLITAHLQPSYLLASLTKVRNKTLYVVHGRWVRANCYNSWGYAMILKMILYKKKIVTVSKGLRNELINKYGFSGENIITIYNPCNVDVSQPKAKLQSIHTRPYILILGRLVEEKNPLLALELYYQGRFYNQYDLIYLGKGPLERSLRDCISDYKLQNHVYLVGFQKNPEVWIKNASLLLSCSRYEGFSMNLVEALICGTPVVAADCLYGPREILVDELKNYLISPEENIQASISTISSALKSYPVISEKYYEKFDGELIIKTYLENWQDNFEA